MPLDKSIKKVLVIGSGPIVIGQAAEFDYSGTQACQAIKDEGIDVVLVNSNPATIMTDRGMATNTYIEPLTAEYVEKIIQKERCDDVGNELWYQMMLECMTVGREMSQRPSFPRRSCPDNRTKERCSACAPVMPPVFRIGAGFFVRRRLFHTVHLVPV